MTKTSFLISPWLVSHGSVKWLLGRRDVEWLVTPPDIIPLVCDLHGFSWCNLRENLQNQLFFKYNIFVSDYWSGSLSKVCQYTRFYRQCGGYTLLFMTVFRIVIYT